MSLFELFGDTGTDMSVVIRIGAGATTHRWRSCCLDDRIIILAAAIGTIVGLLLSLLLFHAVAAAAVGETITGIRCC